MKFSILRLVFWSAMAFNLASCSITNIKDLSVYGEVDGMERAEVFPNADQLDGAGAKVAIYDVEDLNEKSKNASVGAAVTAALEKFLHEASAEIIDRAASAKYKDEIILASQQSGGGFSGPQFADYVVQGKLTGVNFSLQLTKETAKAAAINFAASLAGLDHKSEAKDVCEYVANIKGTLNVYELPSMKLVKPIQFEQSLSETTDPDRSTKNVGDVVLQLFTNATPARCEPDMDLVSGLINKTASDAIRKYRIDLQNMFAPKAYISGLLKFEDSYIAKITIGENKKLKQDTKVEIYNVVTTSNSLTGALEKEERIVAEALVTNQIQSKSAYIIFEKPEHAKKVKLGDIVKVKFEKGTFESAKDLF